MSSPRTQPSRLWDTAPATPQTLPAVAILTDGPELPPTPFYLLDETRLLHNLKIIQTVRERSGAKSVLALKCFATWKLFPLMSRYLDGTTSSSLYEARLGHEEFGGETHAYSVAYTQQEIEAVSAFADKIIFNSVSQLQRLRQYTGTVPLGLRINPAISHAPYDLADPCRPQSRLGAANLTDIQSVIEHLSGLMFHCQCENDSFPAFARILDHIDEHFAPLLASVEWVSLGGGILFTDPDYPLDKFCQRLAQFAARHQVQVYLEPGEAVVAGCGFLYTRVLDVTRNPTDIAIVDAGVEPHMLDLLIYRLPATLASHQPPGKHPYQIAGRTCLAGDIFGEFHFPQPLKPGDLLAFADAAGYTIVKKNWFNGLPMPAIVIRRRDHTLEVVQTFNYTDYKRSLS
jgi:carboxynorspermidine decarboxylase